jgi:hypothetical protein
MEFGNTIAPALSSGFFHGIRGYNFAAATRPREFGASFQCRFAGSGR